MYNNMNLQSLGNHPLMDPPLFKRISDYYFKFDDLLGQGSFSKVYKGHNQRTREDVAIKVIQLKSLKTPVLEKLLLSEIEVLKGLNHPNILKCHQVLSSDRNCYIITELCRGGSLEAKLKSSGILDEETAGPIIADVFRGLSYLSEMQVVHRDIKVANIFLSEGTAKIADFGFAKRSIGKFKDASIGSPVYMAPQGYINHIYGPKTDVWGFGVLAYQLFHGCPPFSACRNESELFYAMTVGLPKEKLRADLPQEIKDVIVKCMEVNEDKRPNMSELANMPYFKKMLQKRSPGKRNRQERSSFKLLKEKLIHQICNQNLVRQKDRDRDSNASKQSTEIGHPHALPSVLPQKCKLPFSFEYQTPCKNLPEKKKLESSDPSRFLNRPQSRQLKSDENNKAKTPLFDKAMMEQFPYKILRGCLTFDECVSALHYGRIIFKFVNLFCQQGDKDHSILFTLTKWLLQLIEEIEVKIKRNEVDYQEDMLIRQEKLEEVCDEYHKKYYRQLANFIVQPSCFKEQKYSLDFMKYYSYGLFQRMDQVITPSAPPGLLQMGYLTIVICEATKLICECYLSGNYRQLGRYNEADVFLREGISKVNYASYLVARQRLVYF